MPEAPVEFRHRTLLLRANRLLGANLVEHGLLTLEQLSAANEKFLEGINAAGPRPPHLLHAIYYDLQCAQEHDVVAYQLEHLGVGILDPRVFLAPPTVAEWFDSAECWATLTMVVDCEEDLFTLITCHALSPVSRDFWTKKLGRPCLWFATSLEAFTEAYLRFAQPGAAA